MKRWSLAWTAFVLAGLVAGAAGLGKLGGVRGRAGYPVGTVERGTFTREVVAEGILEADESTPLSSPTEAQSSLTVAWLAPDGSAVRENDVVIRFDPTEMERNLREGESEKETAENRIVKGQVESEAVLGKLDRDAEIADLELTFAKEFQSKDVEVFSRSEIIESEIDEDLASRRRDHALDAREIREDLSEVEQDLLEIQKKKAEMKIEQAEDGLRSLEVRAPHDGIFVLERTWRGVTQVGQSVWSGEKLAEIPRLDVMKAKVFVLEADAGGLEEGCRAAVVLEAHPTETYGAAVRSVATLAQPRTRASPVQYFEVDLALDRTDPRLMKPGQRVRTTLFVEKLEGVLTVPREAVVERDGGEKVVFREAGGAFEEVEVETGSSALGRIVIEDGVEEGDVLALGDPTRQSEEAESGNGTPSGSRTPGVAP